MATATAREITVAHGDGCCCDDCCDREAMASVYPSHEVSEEEHCRGFGCADCPSFAGCSNIPSFADEA